MERCELSLIRINPKPIGIPGIISRLIRTVNHFIGKENRSKYRYILPSNSQSKHLSCIERFWRAAGGVDWHFHVQRNNEMST